MRRKFHRSQNDPLEARCSKAGRLRLGAGPLAVLCILEKGMLRRLRNDKIRGGLSLYGGRRSVAPGMIRREQKDAVGPNNSVIRK